jgi:hypothetical protein
VARWGLRTSPSLSGEGPISTADVAPRGRGAPRPPQSLPPPLPVLADPTTWSDCGAFKAGCTCSALCV